MSPMSLSDAPPSSWTGPPSSSLTSKHCSAFTPGPWTSLLSELRSLPWWSHPIFKLYYILPICEWFSKLFLWLVCLSWPSSSRTNYLLNNSIWMPSKHLKLDMSHTEPGPTPSQPAPFLLSQWRLQAKNLCVIPDCSFSHASYTVHHQ